MSVWDWFKKEVPTPTIPLKSCRNCTFYRPQAGYFGYCLQSDKNLTTDMAQICDSYMAFGTVTVTSLDASVITSGILDIDRIPVLTDIKIPDLETLTYGGAFATDQIPSLDAAKIASGILAEARIPHTLADLLTLNTGLAIADGQSIDWSDVKLYRQQANYLRTDDVLVVGNQNYNILLSNSEQALWLGDRATTWDIKLYRGDANVLKTDDNFDALSLKIGGTETIDSSRLFSGDFDPSLLQRGTGSTDASGDDTVTFPEEFAATPLVFLQAEDAAAKGIVIDVVSRSTTQVVVKARKVTGITSGSTDINHRHSFSDSFTTSTPTGTIMVVLDHVMGLCPSSHALCEQQSKNRGTVASDSHTHTGSASGNTGYNNPSHDHTVDAPVLAADFMWLAIKA